MDHGFSFVLRDGRVSKAASQKSTFVLYGSWHGTALYWVAQSYAVPRHHPFNTNFHSNTTNNETWDGDV